MKLVGQILGIKKKVEDKTLAEHKRETLIREGRQQFKKLVDLGLGVPVSLL